MSRFPLLLLTVATMFASCVAPTSNDRIKEAAAKFDYGDYEACGNICDDILADSAEFHSLSVAQLCAISEMYINLGNDVDEDDASAAKCLKRARVLSPDSVDDFIRSKSAEVATYLSILDNVGTYMDIPRDSLLISEDILLDSIPE